MSMFLTLLLSVVAGVGNAQDQGNDPGKQEQWNPDPWNADPFHMASMNDAQEDNVRIY